MGRLPALFFIFVSMILLRKNVDCLICLTLAELAIESLPNHWLFVFEKEQSQGRLDYTYFQQFVDVSESSEYFNLFQIHEGVNINIPLLGDYFYRIYQMPNSISIDPLQGHLVELGKMRLIDAVIDTPTFNSTTNRKIHAN